MLAQQHRFFYTLALVISVFILGMFLQSNLNIGDRSCTSQVYHRTNVPSRIKDQKKSRKLPQCIIIGVRKGGTRALLEYLHLHSHVQVADEEVHFFDNDVNYSKGLEHYRSQMPLSYDGQITIEKSPAYFIKVPKVAERIHHMNSSIRLIVILRDPITRLISDYTQVFHLRRSRNLPVRSFEEKMMMPSHSKNKHISELHNDMKLNTEYKPLQISIYSQFIQVWLQYFHRSQIHFVNGNNLITSPVNELKKVEQFLNLPSEINDSMFYFDPSRGFHCLKISEGSTDYNYEKRRTKCLINKGRKHPHVKKVLIEKLYHFYQPHNERLFKMINESFKWPSLESHLRK